MIQEVQEILMNKFWLTSYKDIDYDLEGHIKTRKVRYAHVLNIEEEITKNCDDF